MLVFKFQDSKIRLGRSFLKCYYLRSDILLDLEVDPFYFKMYIIRRDIPLGLVVDPFLEDIFLLSSIPFRCLI